jgi:hypothetical protein
MKLKTGFALLMLATSVHAGPYLELGISGAVDTNASRGRSCISDWKAKSDAWGCSDNPLGYLSVGYAVNGFSISAEHWSSIASDYDAGLNLVSIRYRFEFKQ